MAIKRYLLAVIFVLVVGIGFFLLQKSKSDLNNGKHKYVSALISGKNVMNPLSIYAMRKKSYPGSALIIESVLISRPDYNRYIVSYQSEGLKEYALLTVPIGEKPKNGWPVILFNHGYIPPAQYSTAISYDSFVNPLASSGYIVFKPDYRGNGNSQGLPVQIYVSPDYLSDSMNALASIKKYKDANSQKIGVFGHSMGGNISLHELVISKDIKAAEIMAGVVGNEADILAWWKQRIAAKSIVGNDLDTSVAVLRMIADYGTPSSNPDYWNSIDPTAYIADITVPVQIQVGTADTDVPPGFSLSLRDKLKNAGKTVDYHAYPGADHNLLPDTSIALSEVVAFFNKYLK